MYRYNFVFYSKCRHPVSTLTIFARNKAEALARAKGNFDEKVRGYTMQRNKVTRHFCMCEIARNGYYVRIGACLLEFMDDGTIEVYDWNGNLHTFTDLLPAIDSFIASVNNAG